jgi:hypothetical protein
MRTALGNAGLAGLLFVLGTVVQAADRQEPALSAAEQAVVAHQIATLKSSVDRQVANQWSNAKKVAELICRPAALPVLKKQAKGVDRVFLGTDASDSLILESDQRLTGSGTFRTPQGWQDFTFTCDVSPETGKVASFTPTLLPAKP